MFECKVQAMSSNRVIPISAAQGQAAGTAAAMAALGGCTVREINTQKLIKTLKENGAVLSAD